MQLLELRTSAKATVFYAWADHEHWLGATCRSQATACNNAFADPDTSSDLVGCRLTGAVKRITDDLKIDFVTIVGVLIPDSAQADND